MHLHDEAEAEAIEGAPVGDDWDLEREKRYSLHTHSRIFSEEMQQLEKKAQRVRVDEEQDDAQRSKERSYMSKLSKKYGAGEGKRDASSVASQGRDMSGFGDSRELELIVPGATAPRGFKKHKLNLLREVESERRLPPYPQQLPKGVKYAK